MTLPPTADIVIINPLGAALDHYTRALARTLRLADREVAVESIIEPSRSGQSRLRWILAYCATLRRARRETNRHRARLRIIVTWPVLGYLDIFLLRIFVGRHHETDVVMHDPEPLVRAVGYDRWSKRLALWCRAKSGLIVHSSAAHDVVNRSGFGDHLVHLPHPLRPTDEVSEAPASSEPVIRVLGQYKPDRDLGLLAEIARDSAPGTRLEVHGRGWPAIDGWLVVDSFVSETRLYQLMASSSAVLIPYRRFFQSGIAIRCFEIGTPFVGPRASSLEELYPSGSPLLVDGDPGCPAYSRSCQQALRAAVKMSRAETRELVADIDGRIIELWSEWIAQNARTPPVRSLTTR